jgi:magnesium transporter
MNTFKYKNVTWIDLENPTRDEMRNLMKSHDIHPLAAEELLLPTSRPKVDSYGDSILLVLHLPARKHTHNGRSQEMDFLVSKNSIITARYETIDAVHKFSKMIEVNSVVERNNLIGEHAGYMFYYMLREIYRSLGDELESISDSLSEIEKMSFTGMEREVVFEISGLSRELLGFKHATSLHEDALDDFARSAASLFPVEFSHYMNSVESEYTKVRKMIIRLSELLSEIRATNSALLETKQNEIMKKFTAVTVISAPLTIISSWFLYETPDHPLRNSAHGFWILGVIMVIITIALTIYMMRKRWL